MRLLELVTVSRRVQVEGLSQPNVRRGSNLRKVRHSSKDVVFFGSEGLLVTVDLPSVKARSAMIDTAHYAFEGLHQRCL